MIKVIEVEWITGKQLLRREQGKEGSNLVGWID